MLYTVKKVEYVEGYKLKLLFSDRSVKIVNLESMLENAKNMFIPLQNLAFFKKVKCDGITICWPNGVDLCPDVLYKIGKDAKPSQVVKNLKKTKVKRSRRTTSKV